MDKELDLYKNISKQMIKDLEEENYDSFNNLLDKRQGIIDDLVCRESIDQFKKLYKKYDLNTMDLFIKEKLDEKLEYTKKEIKEYKSKMRGNNAYSNIKKEKFNIFSQKV